MHAHVPTYIVLKLDSVFIRKTRDFIGLTGLFFMEFHEEIWKKIMIFIFLYYFPIFPIYDSLLLVWENALVPNSENTFQCRMVFFVSNESYINIENEFFDKTEEKQNKRNSIISTRSFEQMCDILSKGSNIKKTIVQWKKTELNRFFKWKYKNNLKILINSKWDMYFVSNTLETNFQLAYNFESIFFNSKWSFDENSKNCCIHFRLMSLMLVSVYERIKHWIYTVKPRTTHT